MNMNVSLTEELANFVKAKVSGGRYASSSEVVREALRLMEKVERQEAESSASFARLGRKASIAATRTPKSPPPTRHRNAPTTSRTQDMRRHKSRTL
jgi:putative addiction module CopG family antidote